MRDAIALAAFGLLVIGQNEISRRIAHGLRRVIQPQEGQSSVSSS